MKKLGYVIAALGAIAVAAPSVASAETVVIKRGGHHWNGARAEFREHRDYDRLGARAEFREHRDRGMHRGWRGHHDRVVVIKKHRY